MKAWKIVEGRKDGFYTLFHGLQGSRKIPQGVWLSAEVKRVRDGAGNNWYQSGFHVLSSRYAAHKYLERFTEVENRSLVVVEVEVDLPTTRPKASSKYGVMLAERMRVL